MSILIPRLRKTCICIVLGHSFIGNVKVCEGGTHSGGSAFFLSPYATQLILPGESSLPVSAEKSSSSSATPNCYPEWALAQRSNADSSLHTSSPDQGDDVLFQRSVTISDIEEYLQASDNALDIGYANLLIGKVFEPRLNVKNYLDFIDKMLETIKDKSGRSNKPETVIAAINQCFYEDHRFTAVIDPFPEDFLINNLVDNKQGRCMSLVALYLAVAKRLKVPVVALCIPEHIYARWEIDKGVRRIFSRGPDYVNIETTLKGSNYSDKHYLEMLGSNPAELHGEFYLRPLSPKETIATYLSPLGSLLRDQGRLDEAISACRLAVKINPGDAEAWNNLGMSYRRKEMKDLAMTSYQRAVEVYPRFAEAWHNMGSIQDEHSKRIEYFKKAITIKPQFVEAWRNLVIAYYENQNYQMAMACANQCRSLGYELPGELLNKIQRHLNAAK